MTLIYDDWGRSALTDAILQKQTQKALMLLRECDDVNHKAVSNTHLRAHET